MADYQTVQVDTTAWKKLHINLDYERLAQKAIRKEIRVAVRNSRKLTVSQLKGIIGKTGKNPIGDPRGAYRAVKMTVYRGGNKSSDGGNISILNKKGAAKGMRLWEPKRGGRSGITRKRSVSARTIQINSYRGIDRAFILRFLDQGTGNRRTEGKVSHLEKAHRKRGWKATRNGAYRGKIAAGNYFGQIASSNIDKEATALSTRIYKLIEEVAQ